MIDFYKNYYKKIAKSCIPQRFAASLIDYILFLGICIGFLIIFGEKVKPGYYHAGGVKGLFPFVTWFLYFIVLEKINQGTLGRRIMKIQVVSLNESEVNYIQVIKRRLCDPLDIWWCLGLLGFILIKNTEFSQRIGDIWAKTTVISTDSKHDIDNAQ